MAAKHPVYGKDHPERFISGALNGDTGGEEGGTHGFQNSSTSNEIKDYKLSRKSQSIKTAFAMDNVGRVYDRFMTSLKDTECGGGPENLKHSLAGTSTVDADELGTSGKTKHVIIPNH